MDAAGSWSADPPAGPAAGGVAGASTEPAASARRSTTSVTCETTAANDRGDGADREQNRRDGDREREADEARVDRDLEKSAAVFAL
ncbi:hypothetical protein ASE64_05295 [Agreia sp. Leaf210]|nr:hypothetical protein ASE64_05295 [Agreia sp. Leaf210]